MNKTIAFILILLFVSCSEPKLEELTLDYSNERAMNDSTHMLYQHNPYNYYPRM
ncbi:hypothetical protein [Lentisphaera araneosa]|uniref:hypothetical protein n=1 Tax=Lentisphaera araneosa TaxID=256847 RepID=UPI0012FA3E01|nr:hypothetical protein [Lentisphaera araneosa]